MYRRFDVVPSRMRAWIFMEIDAINGRKRIAETFLEKKNKEWDLPCKKSGVVKPVKSIDSKDSVGESRNQPRA